MTVACPWADRVEELADGNLATQAAADCRQHLADCRVCAEQYAAMAPLTLFAELPRKTLPAPAWTEVMGNVSAVVADEPRARRSDWLFGWLRTPSLSPSLSPWLSPAAMVLAGVVLLATSLAILQPPAAVPVAVMTDVGGRGPRDFVLLSNPQARVTHLLVTAADGTPEQLTMVIDASLADLF